MFNPENHDFELCTIQFSNHFRIQSLIWITDQKSIDRQLIVNWSSIDFYFSWSTLVPCRYILQGAEACFLTDERKIYLSIYLSIYLAVYLSIFLSFYLSIHPVWRFIQLRMDHSRDNVRKIPKPVMHTNFVQSKIDSSSDA